MTNNICAVYRIDCKANNKFYIGSSKNLTKRFYDHRYQLRYNLHLNKHLQNAWNKYGEDSFSFSIIETVTSENQLLFTEQFYIDLLNPSFNIRTEAVSNRGLKHSEETINIMKLKAKARCQTPGYKEAMSQRLKGRIISPSSREKMRIAWIERRKRPISAATKKKFENRIAIKGERHGHAKLSEEQAKAIKVLANYGINQGWLAQFFSVSRSVISSIANGKTWNHI